MIPNEKALTVAPKGFHANKVAKDFYWIVRLFCAHSEYADPGTPVCQKRGLIQSCEAWFCEEHAAIYLDDDLRHIRRCLESVKANLLKMGANLKQDRPTKEKNELGNPPVEPTKGIPLNDGSPFRDLNFCRHRDNEDEGDMCGRPMVYESILGGDMYCEEHAHLCLEQDADIMFEYLETITKGCNRLTQRGLSLHPRMEQLMAMASSQTGAHSMSPAQVFESYPQAAE